MNFLSYIKSNEDDLELTTQEIEEIKELLSELDEEELDELGSVLYDLFFDEEEDFEETEDNFNLEDILDMAKTLGKSGYEIVKDLMEEDPDYDDLEDDGGLEQNTEINHSYFRDEITKIEFKDEEEELDEAGIQRRMQARNMNKKKRKFMAIRKSQFKRSAPKRKRVARQNRHKNKRYRRANKHKIKQYQKSRSLAIKRGRHKVKIRRQ